MKNILLLLFMMLFLSACVGPSQSTISSINYGPKPKRNINVKELNNYLVFFKDPDSAHVKIIEQAVKKAYIINSYTGDKISWSGWAGRVTINAKNSYGAYTGYKYYYFTVDDVGLVTGLFDTIGKDMGSIHPEHSWLKVIGENM